MNIMHIFYTCIWQSLLQTESQHVSSNLLQLHNIATDPSNAMVCTISTITWISNSSNPNSSVFYTVPCAPCIMSMILANIFLRFHAKFNFSLSIHSVVHCNSHVHSLAKVYSQVSNLLFLIGWVISLSVKTTVYSITFIFHYNLWFVLIPVSVAQFSVYDWCYIFVPIFVLFLG